MLGIAVDDDDVARTVRAAAAAADGAIGRDEFSALVHTLLKGETLTETAAAAAASTATRAIKSAPATPQKHAAIKREADAAVAAAAAAAGESELRARVAREFVLAESQEHGTMGRVSNSQRAGGGRPHAFSSLTP
jgi:hypothetical protein